MTISYFLYMWSLNNNRIKLVEISKEYTSFLRAKVYSKIPQEHKNSSFHKPFIGILISNNDIKYVIPLSSPKEKHTKMHNTIDFHKIDGGKYGAINFNNMFPVPDNPEVYKFVSTSLNNVNNLSTNNILCLLEIS